VACANALGKLLLGQTQRLATCDHDPGDPLVRSNPCELLPVHGASLRTAPVGPMSRAYRRDARTCDYGLLWVDLVFGTMSSPSIAIRATAHATGRAPGSSAGMAAAVPWLADRSVDRSAGRSSAACAHRAQQRSRRPARTHPVRDSRRLACEARRIPTDAFGQELPNSRATRALGFAPRGTPTPCRWMRARRPASSGQ
jgi:hypothetical protein